MLLLVSAVMILVCPCASPMKSQTDGDLSAYRTPICPYVLTTIPCLRTNIYLESKEYTRTSCHPGSYTVASSICMSLLHHSRKVFSLTLFRDLHTASDSDDWNILADEWDHQVGGRGHCRVHSRSLCMVSIGCMASRGIIGRRQNYPKAAGRIVSYLTDSHEDLSLMIIAGSA